jgi:hypothetical protein
VGYRGSSNVAIGLTLLFLLVETSTADDDLSADTASAPRAYENEATPPRRGDDGGLEELLMSILAGAAVLFQLRRKYKASERAWQRIVTSIEQPTATALEPMPHRSLTTAAIRWQQTP